VQVHVYKKQPDGLVGAFICTGSLFTDKPKLLTAAHCMYPYDSVVRIDITRSDGRTVPATEFFPHKSYKGGVSLHDAGPDVAIIEYDDLYDTRRVPHRFQPTMKRIRSTGARIVKLRLAGYGVTETGQSGVLHHAAFDLEGDDCVTYSKYHGCATTGEMSMTASCGGDSGGPWYIKEKSGYKIIGVHMGGSNCETNGIENPHLRTATSYFTWVASVSNFWKKREYAKYGGYQLKKRRRRTQ